MANPKFGISYIRYAGFSRLDKSERERIEKIVGQYIEKIKRVSPLLGLRLHLKSIHVKGAEFTRQIPVNQIDGILETGKGHFYANAKNRNPYSAVADILANLLKKVKGKHPHKEEWKEEFKKYRKLKRKKKT